MISLTQSSSRQHRSMIQTSTFLPPCHFDSVLFAPTSFIQDFVHSRSGAHFVYFGCWQTNASDKMHEIVRLGEFLYVVDASLEGSARTPLLKKLLRLSISVCGDNV